MTESTSDESCPSQISNLCKRRHWGMYWLIIFVCVGSLFGRIMTVQNHQSNGESPFFSANDRSRWCTIRSLVDKGTYEIDEVLAAPSDIRWDTVDKVKHLGKDNQFHSYSSKPTLLPTLLAGKYWLIQKLTGRTLEDDTLFVARALLLFCNGVPYFVFLFLLASMLERIVVHDWTRYFVLCAAGLGTFLSTFAVTLNNHLPAAFSVMVAIYCLDRIYRTGPVCHDQAKAGWIHYATAGLFAAFAAANELPALSFFACAGALCLYQSPKKAILGFVPAAAVVAAGFFGTNYLAHDTWKPAYAHRNDGDQIAMVQGSFVSDLDGMDDERMDDGRVPDEILDPINEYLLASNEKSLQGPVCRKSYWKRDRDAQWGRWVVCDDYSNNQFAVEQTALNEFTIYAWGNWYDYSGSYWASGYRSEVDRGQPNQVTYAFHLLFGHHGIFSLTPIWLFSLAGLLALPWAKRMQLQWLGAVGIVLSLVVFTFYLNRPINDRNYGGVTSGLRWMFWLIPIWLVAMVPVIDSLGKKQWGKILCLAVLAVSIASAMYSSNNPWTHPWLYEIWDSIGLPK